MRDENLRQWLLAADQAACPVLPSSSALAARVRQRIDRRRRTVRWTGAALTCAIGTLAIAFAYPIRTRAPAASPRDPDVIRREIALLRGEAQAQLALIDDLRRNYSRAGTQTPAIETLRRREDECAFMLVHQADRWRRRFGPSEQSDAGYRTCISLFADTPSADLARQRLSERQPAGVFQ